MRRLKDLEGALQPLQRFSQANPELEQVSSGVERPYCGLQQEGFRAAPTLDV